MILFSITYLMDEQKCYGFLVDVLHPHGLGCPRCHRPIEEIKIHNKDMWPVLCFRCSCGRIFNAFAETDWQGTHYSCSIIVKIFQGITQGTTTSHLGKELLIDRGCLIRRRHKIQQRAADAQPIEPLPDIAAESDEMFQNAGEKRCAT